jgi:hypothetical protein
MYASRRTSAYGTSLVFVVDGYQEGQVDSTEKQGQDSYPRGAVAIGSVRPSERTAIWTGTSLNFIDWVI